MCQNPNDLRSLIPFLALLRRPAARGSPEPLEDVVQTSTAMLVMCLLEQTEGLSFRDVTRVSFRELIAPCLKVPAAGAPHDLAMLSIQSKLPQLIIGLEEDEAILETILRERVISHTTSLFKRVIGDPGTQYILTPDIEDVTLAVSRWFDSMFLI